MSAPGLPGLTKRLNEITAQYLAQQRSAGAIVSSEAEQLAYAIALEIANKLAESGTRFEKEDRLEDPVRSRDIPDRLEKFRLAHKNVFKADDGDEPAEITGPEYAKRMKETHFKAPTYSFAAEAPAAFVRHDALDVRPEDLRLKHVDKQLPSGETIKVPLLQLLADDIREKCNLPATAEVDKLVKSYLINHARSRADYQKQLEKSKPYREVKNWKECHKRPDRAEAQLRLEQIEDALKKGGRKMKKQVHKFPVHELEDLANWLRKIINEPAGGVQVPSGAELGLMTQPIPMRPPSPSSEDKRKRKSMS